MAYCVKGLRYRFERVIPKVDTTNPWEIIVDSSSRDEYEQFTDGTYTKTYQISRIGVDSNGFYYKYYSNQINADGLTTTFLGETKVYWGSLSGDFIIEWAIFDATYNIPDDVFNAMFGLQLPIVKTDVPHVTVTYTLTNYDNLGGQPQSINLHLEPDTAYRFTDSDITVLVTVPNINDGEHGVCSVNSTNPYYSQFYSSQLNLDGSVDIDIDIDRSGLYGSYLWGILEFAIDKLTNLIKTQYDVDLSLDNITPSNPSTTASSSVPYVNVLSANVDYTMDDVDVVVTMDGFILDNVYDSVTHTITIPTVTGDLIISASAKKLHTFNFYSMDGLTLHGSITAYSIKDIEISLVGNTRTITVDGTVVATYTEVIPSDYGVFGLSTTLNSTRVVITTNYIYRGSFANDTNFYEVVAEIPVPSGDLSLSLYHNRSEKDVLFKDIQLIGSLTGTLRESCDVINPQIVIEYSGVPDFDYVFIPYFNRYYYVSDVVSVKQSLWLISLKVDVLMTYKDLIKLQTAHVSRNEYKFDNDKRDSYISFDIEHEVVYKPIQIADSGFFDSTYVSLVTINAVKYDTPVIKEI